ncbi:hypothetical protein B0H16DRAFT_1689070 [Mycena metata]|uniref:Uncharacterized protein n=1 Tax=Mycena metata TaxID=1033252 RepID=A0AAD7NGN0_9AGAR|nr:hypothetical protein B0H16DRAFT_1689070 [Mycena metata]
MYGAPMNALRKPGSPVAPRYHRKERERERDRDRERLGDRDREREQRERERERERDRDREREQCGCKRNQLQMQCKRERAGPRTTTAGTRARPSHHTRRTRRSRGRAGRLFLPHMARRRLPHNRNPRELQQAQQQQQQHQLRLGPGSVQTGPHAFRWQFYTSFVPVREASPPLPPLSSGAGGRKGSSAGGGGRNLKRDGGMIVQRDAYGTWSPAMDGWEMGASNANNANNTNNANANSSFNSGVVGGSTYTGAFSLGVGHLGVGIDTPRANASRAGSSVAAIHSSYQFCSDEFDENGSRDAIMSLIGNNKLAVPAEAPGTSLYQSYDSVVTRALNGLRKISAAGNSACPRKLPMELSEMKNSQSQVWIIVARHRDKRERLSVWSLSTWGLLLEFQACWVESKFALVSLAGKNSLHTTYTVTLSVPPGVTCWGRGARVKHRLLHWYAEKHERKEPTNAFDVGRVKRSDQAVEPEATNTATSFPRLWPISFSFAH